jgi:hypothetical protein
MRKDTTKKERARTLDGFTYSHAAILADHLCDPQERADVREVETLALAELARLTGIELPTPGETKRAHNAVRQTYLTAYRTTLARAEAAGLACRNNHLPRRNEGAHHNLDPYAMLTLAIRLADALGDYLHAFWCADHFEESVDEERLRKNADQIRDARKLRILLDSFGERAVRERAATLAAEARRIHRRAAKQIAGLRSVDGLAESLAAARVWEVIEREDGGREAVTEAVAVWGELGDDWQRFIAEAEGGAP